MEDREKSDPNLIDDDGSQIENSEEKSRADAASDDDAPADDADREITIDEADVSDTTGEVETESERFIRLAAEFDNYKKRTAREFESIVRRANERLLRDLVDIVDNFERALSEESVGDDIHAYRKGVELIYNQLSGLLAKEGITAIEAVGKPFDPTYHEAVMQVESDDFDEGIVVQEVQKGYKIDGKVLRHARVIVSRGPAGDASNENSKTNE